MLPIATKKNPQPPRIFIYGPSGIGKTTLAASFPGALVLPAEDGAEQLDVARLPTPKTWAEALGFLDAVAAEPGEYRALVIDSVTALERLCFAFVAAVNGKPTVEAMGYGTGFPFVGTQWQLFLDKLDIIKCRGLAVVLIGHQAVVTYADPRSDPYDRFSPRMHKCILPMTIEWSDCLFCGSYKVFTDKSGSGFNKERNRAVGGGDRVMYAREMPTAVAKNRYGLPEEIAWGWADLFAGITATFATAK